MPRKYKTPPGCRQNCVYLDVSNGKGMVFEVDFLRKKSGKKKTFFVRPDVPDVTNVERRQILRVVQGVNMRRGKMSTGKMSKMQH